MYATIPPGDISKEQFPLPGQVHLNQDIKIASRKRSLSKHDGDILDDIKKKRSENIHITANQNEEPKRFLHIPVLNKSEKPLLKRGLSDGLQAFHDQAIVIEQKMEVTSDIECSTSDDKDASYGENVTFPKVEKEMSLNKPKYEKRGSPFPEWNSGDQSKLRLMNLPKSFEKRYTLNHNTGRICKICFALTK